MKTILPFIFLLIWTSQSKAQTTIMDSLVIKPEMKSAPLFVANSAEKLSGYLTKNDSSDTQKVLNIYTWITKNIRYNLKAYLKIKSKKYTSVSQTLQKRKGICYQYSDLFNALCEYAGIPSLRIDGYSRGQYYNEDDTFYESDHSWNAVKLEGKWYLLDLTWGSGYMAQRKQPLKRLWAKIFNKDFVYSSYRYKKSQDFQYFLTPPKKMIVDHLPADPLFQLLEFPVSVPTYESNEWKYYHPKKDSAFSQIYKIESLYEKLDYYYKMSPIQYNYAVAFNAYSFNPKNTKMLAYAEHAAAPLQRVSGVDINEQITGNKNAIKEFRSSIAYGKKHESVIKKETAKTKKVVLSRIKAELYQPAAYKAKRVKLSTNRYGRRLKNWSVDSEKYEKRIQSYAMAKARLMPVLKEQPKAKYNKPTTVRKNKELIAKITTRVDSLFTVSDTLNYGYKNTIENQHPLAKKLVKLSLESTSEIEGSTQKFITDRRFGELSESWSRISKRGSLIDSLEEELNDINEVLKKTYRAIGEINSKIRADVSLGQKLIIQNCRLAGMDQCDGKQFAAFNQLRRNAYANNLSLLKMYQQMINRDYDNFKVTYDLLVGQSKLLAENKRYIDYFKLSSLGNIEFKRRSGLFDIYFLRKKSNLEIKKLIRVNEELHKRKRKVR